MTSPSKLPLKAAQQAAEPAGAQAETTAPPADAVRVSTTGRLSISIEDLGRSPSFRSDLEVLKKIESLLARRPAFKLK
jgi:hypothetical protein